MLWRFKNAAVTVALIFSIGLHWPILQSIAWLNMLVEFSAQEGLQEAVVKTFDGNHPCKLCHFVSEGKKAEKESPKPDAVKKLDPAILAAFDLRIDPQPFQPPSATPPFCEFRSYPPLSPPPDLA